MIESSVAQSLREGTNTKRTSVLKQQLVREITCLERQLERVKDKENYLEGDTLTTYQEMIDARRKMLHNLPWEEE